MRTIQQLKDAPWQGNGTLIYDDELKHLLAIAEAGAVKRMRKMQMDCTSHDSPQWGLVYTAWLFACEVEDQVLDAARADGLFGEVETYTPYLGVPCTTCGVRIDHEFAAKHNGLCSFCFNHGVKT